LEEAEEVVVVREDLVVVQAQNKQDLRVRRVQEGRQKGGVRIILERGARILAKWVSLACMVAILAITAADLRLTGLI
jgi:hypothetical protein